MEENNYLGIDGGQTSTLAVICDQNGSLRGVGHGGPSNHIHELGGMERLRSALADSIRTAWQAAGLADTYAGLKPVFRSACCGMTGGMDQVPGLIAEYAEIGRLRVDVDTHTAHAGALAGRPGVVIIAGTGSAAYGVNAAGQSAQAGGWAYLIGDEGSAFDIGRQALTAAARMIDGRGPDTAIMGQILEYFQKETFMEVRALLYAADFQRAQLAALARLVSQSAEEGDPVARDILERAGVSLGEIALAVLRRLEFQDEAQVSYVGGVFRAGDLILSPLARFLEERWPGVKVRPPAFAPVIGAVLLSLRTDGIEVDKDLLERLAQANSVLDKQ